MQEGEVAPRLLSVGSVQRAEMLSQLLEPPAPGRPMFQRMSSRGFLTITGEAWSIKRPYGGWGLQQGRVKGWGGGGSSVNAQRECLTGSGRTGAASQPHPHLVEAAYGSLVGHAHGQGGFVALGSSYGTLPTVPLPFVSPSCRPLPLFACLYALPPLHLPLPLQAASRACPCPLRAALAAYLHVAVTLRTSSHNTRSAMHLTHNYPRLHPPPSLAGRFEGVPVSITCCPRFVPSCYVNHTLRVL